MSGRQTYRARCAESGCTELAFYDRLTVADRRALLEQQQRSPWRCTRHRVPSEVLGQRNLTRTTTLVADRSKRFSDLEKLFWREEGAADVGSEFTFGPGFKAWADDFPEGTRLTITAQITQRATSDTTEAAK